MWFVSTCVTVSLIICCGALQLLSSVAQASSLLGLGLWLKCSWGKYITYSPTSILSVTFFENEKLWVSTNRSTSARSIEHPDLHLFALWKEKLPAPTEEMGSFPWKKSLLLWWAYYVGRAMRCAPADHRPNFHHLWLIFHFWVSSMHYTCTQSHQCPHC